jgi:hypothetical protein
MMVNMVNKWHEMADKAYFAYPAVSNSLLKDVHVGGTAWAKAKQAQEWRPSEAMQKGTALHYALFDPGAFINQVIEKQSFSGTGAVNRRKAWEMEHKHLIQLGAADYDRICHAADLARAYAGPFVDGRMEVAGIADIPGGTQQAKIKVDYLTDSAVWDVKKCANVDRKFAWQARDLHYDMQAAWYLDVAEMVDDKPREFYWLCIKETDPVDIRVYRAELDTTVAQGRNKYRRALKAWTEACHSGTYEPNIEPLNLEEI